MNLINPCVRGRDKVQYRDVCLSCPPETLTGPGFLFCGLGQTTGMAYNRQELDFGYTSPPSAPMKLSEGEGNTDHGPRLRLALLGPGAGWRGGGDSPVMAVARTFLLVKGPAILFGKRERGLVLESGNIALSSD